MSKKALFTPGQVIPQGYAVVITSWENDGDDYQDNVVSGIQTVSLLNQVLQFVKWFSHLDEDMGNDDIQTDEVLSRFWTGFQDGSFDKEFFEHFLPNVKLPHGSTYEEHDDWISSSIQLEYEIGDLIRKFLGTAVQYDYDFARMVEKVHVHFFKEEYKVPELPSTVVKFDGSWGSKDTTWKV